MNWDITKSLGDIGTVNVALGHSLGEITALTATNAISLRDAISLVVITSKIFMYQ